MEAYLDNAATTQVFDSVKDIMIKTLREDYGNPSSMHSKGMKAEQYIKESKQIIAKNLKVDEKEIIFTSGGTESNNQALIGTAFANKRAGNHIITTRIEHPSVYNPLIYLEDFGFRITYLNVDNKGKIDIEQLKNEITDETILVSVMYVNNEIGAVQEIEQISNIIKEANKNTLFHVDAIQAFGKYLIYPKRLGIDLLSISGHKIHGPKGSGILFVRDKVKVKPILFGGDQQKGLRSGTENVPAIAGLGQAVFEIYNNHEQKINHLYELKQYFIDRMKEIEEVTINGLDDNIKSTAPHIISVSFAGIRSEVLLHALEEKNVYVSAGSACSSNHPSLSGTLIAIGVKKELLDSTIRFSFSVNTTREEIDYAVSALNEIIPLLRKYRRH
ncbi:cysteine desulfurase family protein [Anaeromicropila herbilytica]|uniref:cysteine desulfurase n=1 Tax=Anaeromicropila herbilytica TaxID=2785025 RepID=A0A7R7EMR0_9FIRM|nr:cysteine desulfurase family protein [Anaeromicropila herbilytica]BCN31721.1 cysteine desulfurase [Anaeromicropila herbilytica]